MTDAQVPGTPESNGARPFVTLSPELAQDPAMLQAVMAESRRELDARDVSAEHRARRAERHRATTMALLALALLVIAFLVHERRDIQAFVQVVQETEDHRLVQIGVPKHLLDYTPPDAAYYDMLDAWVQKVAWRGKDRAKEETIDGFWVDQHTCPSAQKALERLRLERKTFEQANRFKDLGTVEVVPRATFKTPTPDTFHVTWEHITTNAQYPKGKTETFTTVFTVGRLNLKTLKQAQTNRLGICVKSFETTSPSSSTTH